MPLPAAAGATLLCWAGILLMAVTQVATAAPGEKSLPEKSLAGAGEVGVISLLGDAFHTVRIGATIFQNSLSSEEVPALGVDRFVEEFTVTALARLGRVKGRALPVPPAERADLYRAGRATEIDEDKVLALARTMSVPLIMVVHRVTTDDRVPGGYGLFLDDQLGRGVRCLYAQYILRIWDARTGKLVGNRLTQLCRGGDEQVPAKRRFADLTPDEQRLMGEVLRSRLEEQLATSLTAVSLLRPEGALGAAPDPGATPARGGSAPRVLDAIGVPVLSAMKTGCKSPVRLTRDCSLLGPSRTLSIDGVEFKVAGNDDGTTTVMFGDVVNKTGALTNAAYRLMKRELDRRGIAVTKVTPIESFRIMYGYVIETATPSYAVWEEFTRTK